MRLFRHRPLCCLCACFVGGLLIGQYHTLPGVLLIAAAALCAGAAIWKRRLSPLCITLLCAGMLLMLSQPAAPDAPSQDGLLRGTVCSEAEDKTRYIRFTLSDATLDGEALPCRVQVCVYDGTADGYPYGAALEIDSARLYTPNAAGNPGGFSYRDYLWRDGIGLCVNTGQDDVRVTPAPHGSLMGGIISLRGYLRERIVALYDEPYRGLIQALVLGDRGALDEEMSSLFSLCGIAHLLALSGLHITLFALFLRRLLSKMRIPKKVCFLLTGLFLAFYALLVGCRASVLRAVICFLLLEMAHQTSRPYDSLTAMMVALAALLIVNPRDLTDTGLILSFSAVSGILMLNDTMTLRALRDARPGHGRTSRPLRLAKQAASLLTVSACAQLGSLPGVIASYHELCLVSLPANLIAVPLVTLILPVAMLSVVFSPIGLFPARLLAVPVQWVLGLVLRVMEWIAQFPLATVLCAAWPVWLILLYAALGVLASPYLLRSLRVRRIFLAAAVLCIPLGYLLPTLQTTEGFEIRFLSVGDADSALLFAEGNVCVIDAGEYDDTAEYLKYEGLTPECVFLTHPHADHILGFREIVESYPPSVLYLPEGFFDCPEADEEVLSIVREAEARGWFLMSLHAGDQLMLSRNVRVQVLGPYSGEVNDPNELSLVLNVMYAGRSILLTGDLPANCETEFYPDCDVLKVAHHGAKGSTSETFLARTRPEIAVISTDGRSSGHPAKALLERLNGCRVYRTDLCGMITLTVAEDGTLAIDTYLEEP